ncbi:dimethylsulfonioproprionate lyase family protein [Pseudaestuariivita atlantica]|uniref:dimethylsulfonioproprionate lyase family protein n=1 Tax=Pseudaestuariivita atlantica TaxID=1317121 RepID=UPI00067CE9CF|nr:dimethylsulfonioproprionate lyase family protein [Pseudaestuariivita atlantica]
MTDPAFVRAFQAAQAIHALPDVQGFVPIDDAARLSPRAPWLVPAARNMREDTALDTPNPDWRDPLVALWDKVPWRETYRDTDIGDDFMDRFGCYELVGHDGLFVSHKMRGFVVYMPANLYYGWHHHPAEEQYTILAGSAEFEQVGTPPRIMRPGESVFHPSNVPHRTITHDTPLLAWVAWRPPHMDIAPVLTEGME